MVEKPLPALVRYTLYFLLSTRTSIEQESGKCEEMFKAVARSRAVYFLLSTSPTSVSQKSGESREEMVESRCYALVG